MLQCGPIKNKFTWNNAFRIEDVCESADETILWLENAKLAKEWKLFCKYQEKIQKLR